MESKICRECNKEKDLKQFFRVMNSKRSLHTCIDCLNAKRERNKRSAEARNTRAGKSSFIRFAMHGISDRDY
jgi:hypothetical protein